MTNRDAGISTRAWGNTGWHFIHCVAYNYPRSPSDTDKKKYKTFFRSLAFVLPCSLCSMEFRQLIQTTSFTRAFKSRKTLTRWVYDAHNAVRQKLKKPVTMTFTEVQKRYESLRAGQTPKIRSWIELRKNSTDRVYNTIKDQN